MDFHKIDPLASTTARPARRASSSAVRQPASATAVSVASSIDGLVSSAVFWKPTVKFGLEWVILKNISANIHGEVIILSFQTMSPKNWC
jgi:hypothetical protein